MNKRDRKELKKELKNELPQKARMLGVARQCLETNGEYLELRDSVKKQIESAWSCAIVFRNKTVTRNKTVSRNILQVK